jgi:hypothetical protein
MTSSSAPTLHSAITGSEGQRVHSGQNAVGESLAYEGRVDRRARSSSHIATGRPVACVTPLSGAAPRRA